MEVVALCYCVGSGNTLNARVVVVVMEVAGLVTLESKVLALWRAMSPPTIVLDRDRVDIPVHCPEIKIVQYECAFYEGDKEFTCRPYTRRFRLCESALGPRRYEITDSVLSQEIRETTKEMLMMTRRK